MIHYYYKTRLIKHPRPVLVVSSLRPSSVLSLRTTRTVCQFRLLGPIPPWSNFVFSMIHHYYKTRLIKHPRPVLVVSSSRPSSVLSLRTTRIVCRFRLLWPIPPWSNLVFGMTHSYYNTHLEDPRPVLVVFHRVLPDERHVRSQLRDRSVPAAAQPSRDRPQVHGTRHHLQVVR